MYCCSWMKSTGFTSAPQDSAAKEVISDVHSDLKLRDTETDREKRPRKSETVRQIDR